MAIYERFSSNPRSWYVWVFDRLRLHGASRVLELGCGTGALWSRNLDRLPKRCWVVLSDLSIPMLLDARRTLGVSKERFKWLAADAEALPFADTSFDHVTADHMLYHVRSLEKTLGEIRRVLRPDGRLFASTNGRDHMRELWQLVARFDPEINAPGDTLGAHMRFPLETGAAILSRYFAMVETHQYDNVLVVTEAEPVVGYVLSTSRGQRLMANEQRVAKFREFVQGHLRMNGPMRITTSSGLFEAHRPKGQSPISREVVARESGAQQEIG